MFGYADGGFWLWIRFQVLLFPATLKQTRQSMIDSRGSLSIHRCSWVDQRWTKPCLFGCANIRENTDLLPTFIHQQNSAVSHGTASRCDRWRRQKLDRSEKWAIQRTTHVAKTAEDAEIKAEMAGRSRTLCVRACVWIGIHYHTRSRRCIIPV